MADAPEHPATLRRSLGRYQIMIYGLGSMLGAGIYALIDDVARLMGSMVWAAFACAMVGALLTSLTYASLGSRYPRAGGAAYITGRAFGSPMISYIVGLAVLMSGLTSMATGTQAIAEHLVKHHQQRKGTYEATRPDRPGDSAKNAPAVKPIAIGVVLLLGLVLLKGIRESMWLNVVCTVIETAGLLFIIAIGIRFWGQHNLAELPAPAPGTSAMPILLLLLNGALLTFYSFIGFEDILNVSEECKNPRVDVPHGLIGAMIAATLIYIAVAITAVSVIPHAVLADSSSPLLDVARTAAPWFTGIGGVYLFVTLFAIGNTALLNYLMGSRLLYGMSRQGLLPGMLGRINAFTRTPVIAIISLFGLVSVLILTGSVADLAKATVLLLLSVFGFMNIALFVLKRRPGEQRGAFEIPSFVPLVGAVVCLGLIGSEVVQPFMNGQPKLSDFTAVLIALGIAMVAALLYLVFRPAAQTFDDAPEPTPKIDGA